jgi:hypothetical protein
LSDIDEPRGPTHAAGQHDRVEHLDVSESHAPSLFGPPCRPQSNEEAARLRFFVTLPIERIGPRE